jgi:acyl-CoA thioester hydrolase
MNDSNNNLTISNFPINKTVVRVTYRDTDQMGFVYYANYLVWFEIGRTELLRQTGNTYKTIEQNNLFLPVRSCFCEYKSPAKYDDKIIIRTSVSSLTHASITFDYQILRHHSNELLASGNTKHACINRDGKIIKAGNQLKKLLNKKSPES